MVPEISKFFMIFPATVLAWTYPTQQKIAKVKNYHSSLAKLPVSYFNTEKLHFSAPINFVIDFDQVFVRIFGNFWYESIRKTQENEPMLET